MEAVHRDYAPKGVKFFFLYKSLAHPELAGGYVQPFMLEERLAHARQAEKQLGASIPWLVDAMDNRLKHALGNRPNSEFIVDPDGVIVRKRAWSDAGQVRKDLEQLVGTVERITREEDVQLKLQPPPKAAAPRGIVARIDRSQMQAIVLQPRIEPGGPPLFAKLRAEADARLLAEGRGKLYLGFHLDPFHEAHWNNLNPPLSITLTAPDGMKLDRTTAQAAKVEAASDADPREFLIDVQAWPQDQPLRVAVTYYACVAEECHVVEQEYDVLLQADRDGGRARGPGAGYWGGEEFADRLLAGDRDGDGKLRPSEVMGLVRPHFAHFDTSGDGLLTRDELLAVADWLNDHHRPGARRPEGRR